MSPDGSQGEVASQGTRNGDFIEIKLEGGSRGIEAPVQEASKYQSDSSSHYKSQAGIDQDIELVQLWLRDCGSRRAVMKQFREQHIDVEALAVMQPRQLAALGVAKVGLQNKLVGRAAFEMKNRRRNPAYLFDAIYETKDSALSRIAAAPSATADSSFVYYDAAASAPLYTIEPRNSYLLQKAAQSFASSIRPSQSSSAQFWKRNGRARSVDDGLAANLVKVRQLQVARNVYRNHIEDEANSRADLPGAGKISEEDLMQEREAGAAATVSGVSPVLWEKRQSR